MTLVIVIVVVTFPFTLTVRAIKSAPPSELLISGTFKVGVGAGIVSFSDSEGLGKAGVGTVVGTAVGTVEGTVVGLGSALA